MTMRSTSLLTSASLRARDPNRMIRFGRAVATSRSTADCTLSAVGAHGGVIVVAVSSIVIKGGQQGHVLDRLADLVPSPRKHRHRLPA
jgi:hypothetical protein